MSLLFTDLSLGSGTTLVTFGTKNDICLFTLREAMHGKPASERPKVEKELRGQLEGKKVVKFRHSGAEIVISMEFIHKLAELYPLEDKQLSESAEGEQETTETEKSE